MTVVFKHWGSMIRADKTEVSSDFNQKIKFGVRCLPGKDRSFPLLMKKRKGGFTSETGSAARKKQKRGSAPVVISNEASNNNKENVSPKNEVTRLRDHLFNPSPLGMINLGLDDPMELDKPNLDQNQKRPINILPGTLPITF